MPALRVCSLYPELMNIYADRGNIAVLRARCEWRGLGFEHGSASLEQPLDPDAHDLFYMGGGQDRDQIAAARDMAATKREALHEAAGRGAVVLAVCGGYQLLGHSYQLGDEELPGVGLVDLKTIREPGPRLIGNCAIEADLGSCYAIAELRKPVRPWVKQRDRGGAAPRGGALEIVQPAQDLDIPISQ